MLTYQNIISYLDNQIPEFSEFKDDLELRENKIIYFNFLATYFINNFSNQELTQKIAQLIDEMSDSNDEDIKIILDDFLLSIHSSASELDLNLNGFKERLSPKSKEIMTANLNDWFKGNL